MEWRNLNVKKKHTHYIAEPLSNEILNLKRKLFLAWKILIYSILIMMGAL